VVACAAVISVRLYQQPNTTELAVQGLPVPSTPSNSEKELGFAPPVLTPTFDMQPTLLPGNRSFRWYRLTRSAPMNLCHSSSNGNHDDQSLLEK
jgi:hypothetical protein